MRNRVVDLKYKIVMGNKLIESARKELFQIENSEKLVYVKRHLREWFEEKDSLIMPLAVHKDNVEIIRVGQYEGNSFVEFENVVIQNLDIKESLGKTLPEKCVLNINRILKVLNYKFSNYTNAENNLVTR